MTFLMLINALAVIDKTVDFGKIDLLLHCRRLKLFA